MNTADVRDTTHTQGIFWAAALPMTCLVITAALLYGYKWDEAKRVSHWLSTKANSDLPSRIATDDITRLTRGKELPSPNQDPRGGDPGAKQRDEKAQSSRPAQLARWRRRDGNKSILRRRTGESLLF
jgi:hypothetical protein